MHILRANLISCQSVHPLQPELAVVGDALAFDEQGKISAVGSYGELRKDHPNAKVIDRQGCYVFPGFIDAHVHLGQTRMIGRYGASLLEWLTKHTFPEEERFADSEYAKSTARLFFNQLLSQGTTTSLTYVTSHEGATDTAFQVAEEVGARVVLGKVSMDIGATKALHQHVADDEEAIRRLIQKWHRKDSRLFYALTPRFALSCSSEMMRKHGDLLEEFPDIYLQTHHAESQAEIEAVAKAYPKASNYFDVYENFGLVGRRSFLGHTVHPTPEEMDRIAATRTRIVHCPTSNGFLGSGLAPVSQFLEQGIPTPIGTDVGAGTSFSIWKTLLTAYKVARLKGMPLSPSTLFCQATYSAAEALGMEQSIGAIEVGKEADLMIIDPEDQPLLSEALERSQDDVEQMLFSFMVFAESNLHRATYIRGRCVWEKGGLPC